MISQLKSQAQARHIRYTTGDQKMV